jgi:hypothetical protein
MDKQHPFLPHVLSRFLGRKTGDGFSVAIGELCDNILNFANVKPAIFIKGIRQKHISNDEVSDAGQTTLVSSNLWPNMIIRRGLSFCSLGGSNS